MKVVLAFDSFKGSVAAEEACEAAACGVRSVLPHAETLCIPLADGGEGTSRILARAMGAEPVVASTTDPLGRPISATYYLCPPQPSSRTAIIEIAAASGLALLAPHERAPLTASTRGTGILMRDAIARGATRIILTLGGSATTDGGLGLLEALENPCTPSLLVRKQSIKIRANRCVSSPVTLCCDVRNPLLGPEGAARIFAPQKGAGEAQVEALETRLEALAAWLERRTGVDVRNLPGGGAAGGVAATLHALYGAPIVSGIDMVLEATRFARHAAGADIIITGEGRIDRQTLMGKTLGGVLRLVQALPPDARPRVAALAGQVADTPLLLSAGFTCIRCIHPAPLPLAEAMSPQVTLDHIEACAASVAQDFG